MAHPVGDGAVSKYETAYQPLVNQELQRAVDGCAADRGQLTSERFSREVIVTAGNGFDDELTRRGDFESLVSKLADQALSVRGGHEDSISSLWRPGRPLAVPPPHR